MLVWNCQNKRCGDFPHHNVTLQRPPLGAWQIKYDGYLHIVIESARARYLGTCRWKYEGDLPQWEHYPTRPPLLNSLWASNVMFRDSATGLGPPWWCFGCRDILSISVSTLGPPSWCLCLVGWSRHFEKPTWFNMKGSMFQITSWSNSWLQNNIIFKRRLHVEQLHMIRTTFNDVEVLFQQSSAHQNIEGIWLAKNPHCRIMGLTIFWKYIKHALWFHFHKSLLHQTSVFID